MRIRSLLLLVPAVLVLWVSPAAAQFNPPTPCDTGLTGFPPIVCGTVHTITSDGSQTPASDTLVAFCTPGFNPTNASCVRTNIGYYNDLSGGTYAGFRTTSLTLTGTPPKQWNVFVWSNSSYYGSNQVPIQQVTIDPALGLQDNLDMPPAPLPPTAISPAPGLTNGPSAFPLIWYSGIDSQRRAWKSLTTYDFYYKYWPYGGTQPATYTRWAANFPCTNPDGAGNCSTTESNMPPGNYLWYIVAKLDTLVGGPGRTVFTTSITPVYLGIGTP